MGEALILDDTSVLCYDHLQYQNFKVALAHVHDLFLKAKINGTKIMRMFSPMIGQFF